MKQRALGRSVRLMILILLAWAGASSPAVLRAQNPPFKNPSLDSNCYFPQIDDPNEMDTILGSVGQNFGSPVIKNMGPKPNGGFGNMLIGNISPSVAFAQPMEAASDSLQTQNAKIHNDLWLMGSLSGSLYIYPIDRTYIQDFGYWGYSLKVGGVWHNRILQFDYHSETEFVFSLDPHRYDYALLYGVSHREASIFDNLMVGISVLNYLRRGDQLTPPSTPNAGDATYQPLTGNVIGLAGSAELYLTPIRYWGLFGMGVYGCLNKGMSYVLLDFSILELNIPITLK
jgi:hypothetical protein